MWIEIYSFSAIAIYPISHSLRGSVDWNSSPNSDTYTRICHSLRGSVDWNVRWEIRICKEILSLPSRECGLKSTWSLNTRDGEWVTPFAGVWIEMAHPYTYRHCLSVTPFAGVWIEIVLPVYSNDHRCCHSLRGSVDWNALICGGGEEKEGHSLRGSVDWNLYLINKLDKQISHSLRGSVDWNTRKASKDARNRVTPFAGVWIEICDRPTWTEVLHRHSLRGSVDWNCVFAVSLRLLALSLPSRECGLKLT